MPHIPLVDLQAAHAEVADEVAVGFKRVFADTAFIGGAEVAAFEAEYAAFNGGGHCVGVANGTDAVVEDAAQSQGARRHGAGAGAGGIAATSFYPGRNLGAYGDAGAVVTTDEGLATAVRRIANHGGLTKYAHDVVGVNSRLDALQAVVLRAKLGRLAAWNAARRRAAAVYDDLLADLDVARPVTLDGNTHVWHLYVVRIPGAGGPARRDAVLRRLNADGIGAGIHYPAPVHRTPAFTRPGYAAGSFPHAERTADEILSLPLHPHITVDEQARVAGSLRTALLAN